MNIRDISRLNIQNQVVLKEIRKISPQDCDLLQKHVLNYDVYNAEPGNALERAYLSIYTSILQQRRIYFALSRRSLQALILNDKNYKYNKETFKNEAWAFILQALYNNFKLFELVHSGKSRGASVYKVIDKQVLEYLEPLVNSAEQLEQSLQFSNRKKN